MAMRPAKASDIRYAVMLVFRLEGSDGGSPGRIWRQCADREGCVTMSGRRPIQEFRMKKPAAGFPARAF